jgi:hypothetical protein
MEFCATRLANLNGPTQTGAVEKFAPSLFTAVGLSTIPARSASAAVSGANGLESLITTVFGSGVSTELIGPSSLLRPEPASVRPRSIDTLTADESIVVPSANFTPSRIGMVRLRPSEEMVGSAVASCGTILASELRS